MAPLPGGEEYKSFHYLMHEQQVKGGRVDYVEAPKPLSFEELYSPREGPLLMGKVSKSFWRTRENFDFHIYELRKEKLIVICCLEMNNKVTFKTVVCSLEAIYKQVDDKKRGDKAEEPLIRKNQKGFADDTSLFAEVVKFLEQRLNIGKDPVVWPNFVSPVEGGDAPASADAGKGKGAPTETGIENELVTEAAVPEPVLAPEPEPEPEGPKERLVQLAKLAADTESYEVPVEMLTFLKVDLSSIPAENLKVALESAKEDKKEGVEAPPPSDETTPAPAPAPELVPAPTPAPAVAPTTVATGKKSTAAVIPSSAKTKPTAKQGSGSKKSAKVAPA